MVSATHPIECFFRPTKPYPDGIYREVKIETNFFHGPPNFCPTAPRAHIDLSAGCWGQLLIEPLPPTLAPLAQKPSNFTTQMLRSASAFNGRPDPEALDTSGIGGWDPTPPNLAALKALNDLSGSLWFTQKKIVLPNPRKAQPSVKYFSLSCLAKNFRAFWNHSMHLSR